MIVHIAGPDVQVMSQLRQRCSWCGAILIDMDLTRVAIAQSPGEPPAGPSTWPLGALIAHEGNAWWTVDPERSAEDPSAMKLPEDCCGLVPPELTGTEGEPTIGWPRPW